MNCVIMGGSGEVGRAVVHALLASDEFSAITMLNRRVVSELEAEPKIRQVLVDTAADQFEAECGRHAAGHSVAISCVGIGSGSMRLTEEEMVAIEVTMLGKFARGCRSAGIANFALLTAVGGRMASLSKYGRVMAKKERNIVGIGFPRLAVFRPGIIVGNAHTPALLSFFTKIVPGNWGNIDQQVLGRAIVAHAEKFERQTEPVVYLHNADMFALAGPERV